MLPTRIEGSIETLKQPEDWDPAQNGHCGGLAIRVDHEDGLQWMRSAWEVEPDELLLLAAGGSVVLGVSGSVHPVVHLTVQPARDHIGRTTVVRELIDQKGDLTVLVETLFPPMPGSTEAHRARCTAAVGPGGAPHATALAMREVEKLAKDRGWCL